MLLVGLSLRATICKGYVQKKQNKKWNQNKFKVAYAILHRNWMHIPWFVQLQRNKIQGLFDDKLQFSRSSIYSINWNSLTSFWTPYWLKHLMESFTIFTSNSAMVVIISNITYVVLLSATTLLCKMTAVTGYDLQSEIQK